MEDRRGGRMTRIFVNGKEVRREDLGKYEIESEDVKRILSEKLSESNERQAG